jgi:hypothetical protein
MAEIADMTRKKCLGTISSPRRACLLIKCFPSGAIRFISLFELAFSF